MRDGLFHTCTKVEFRVSIARIGGDVEFIHLDKIEAIKTAVV